MAGCQSAGQVVSSCFSCSRSECVSGSSGELARHYYELACEARHQRDACAADLFYQAAIASWPLLPCGDGVDFSPADAWEIYHESVAGFITEAQRTGRYNRCGQFTAQPAQQPITVPVACLGLPWEARDVNRLVIVDPQVKGKIENYHACSGVGVPVIAVRERGNRSGPTEKFFASQTPFAATAILRPPSVTQSCHDGAPVLELYDPLEVSTVQVHGQSLVMARDISAPFVYQSQTTENTGMLGFLDPGVPEDAQGLRFIEPYQPGKIPIVFIHGLLSDPSTWFDTANDLREETWFNEHYQIWAFRYASGMPFVTSAMFLRSQMQQAVITLDPQRYDPALRQIVLVGHSMGGLIAKLQVTESEDRIWNSFANVPFNSMRANGQVRSALAQRCFFEPQPFVRRVVFIATPHGGSSFATRGVGRFGSSLVQPPSEAEEMHEELVAANPGVFTEQFERRVPTSIDLLEPEDPTLQTIRTMHVSPCVRLHSIIGTGRTMVLEGPGDGAVAVESALHPGVVSQRFVDATHTEIQRHPDTQQELRQILRMHLMESRAAMR